MSIFDSPSSGGSGVNDIFGSNSNPFDGSSFGSQVFSAPPVKLSAWTRWTNIGLISLSAFGWIPIFLNWGTDNAIFFSIVGYVITPFASTGLLIVARAQHLKLQKKSNYLLADGRDRVKIVGIISGVSFLIAIPHILYVANYIGVALQ